MSSKPVGIKDVAAAAGVSVTTVSQVLNNVAYARVGAETRDRVRQAASRLGYGPNRLARALRTRRSGVIGVICEEIATVPDAGRVILGSDEAARRRGYNIMLISSVATGSDGPSESDVAELLDRKVDGVLYVASGRRALRLPTRLTGLPAVLVDADDVADTLPSVKPDRPGGVRLAVTALTDAGHTRIGMLNTSDEDPARQSTLHAFQDTLADDGLEFRGDLVQSGPSTAAGSYAAALRLLKLENPPTAVFCFTDAMAMGLYRAAAEMGLTIPGALSVVGFGNQEMIAGNLHPALTTVELPRYAMGARAAEHLIDAVEGTPGTRTARQAVLECTLVQRDSVAPFR